MILPTIGLLKIGDFAVADRYTYLPYLGLFFIFAKAIILIYKKNNKYIKALITIFCIITFVILNYLSYNRIIEWQLNKFSAPSDMKYYKFKIKK
jgi:hypothetical protein